MPDITPEPPCPPELTEQQWRGARRIAQGASAVEVAKEEGVDLLTVLEWRYAPAFVRWLRLAKEARITYANARIAALLDDAHQALRDCLVSDNDKVRLEAAKEVLRLNGAGPEYSHEVDLQRKRENALLALQFVHGMLGGQAEAQAAIAKLMQEGE